MPACIVAPDAVSVYWKKSQSYCITIATKKKGKERANNFLLMRKKMEGSKHVVEYDVSSTTRGIVLSKRHHGKHRAAAVASKKASDKAYDFDMLVKKGKIGPRDENSDEREDVDVCCAWWCVPFCAKKNGNESQRKSNKVI